MLGACVFLETLTLPCHFPVSRRTYEPRWLPLRYSCPLLSSSPKNHLIGQNAISLLRPMSYSPPR